MCIIVAVLFSVFNVGSMFYTITTEKIPLQQEARNVIGWIMKDLRQTSSAEILNGAPSAQHLQFRLCAGHDGTTILWSPSTVEYTYDPDADTLTRVDHATGQSWQFTHIVEAPFNTAALSNSFLGVTIVVEKQVRGTIAPRLTLTAEVNLRNG